MNHLEEMIQKQIGSGGNEENVRKAIEFLSTHPRNDKRAEYLELILKETLELREKCGCPRLPSKNPIQLAQKRIEEEQRKSLGVNR